MKPYLILTMEQAQKRRQAVGELDPWLEPRLAVDLLQRSRRHETGYTEYEHLCVAFVEIAPRSSASMFEVAPGSGVVVCLMKSQNRGVAERIEFGNVLSAIDPMIRAMILARFKEGILPEIGRIKYPEFVGWQVIGEPTTKSKGQQ